MSIGEKVASFRQQHFPEIGDVEWCDWRWQLRRRIRDLASVERIIHLSPDEREAIQLRGDHLPLGITPYYAALLDPLDAQQGLRRTMIPSTNEFVVSHGERDDPLGEDDHSPLPGLVHTYPDKVLFLVTDFCATYCRYCTRARMVGKGEFIPDRSVWEKVLAYIREHEEIRDVLLSGGDPLILADDRLEWLLQRIKEIPHVEFIRIGTKLPAVLPYRITQAFVDMLKKYHPVWMSIHFTHPDELTPECQEACNLLADAGVPMGSQTVLLKGVNDSVEAIKKLSHELLKVRVKPYYLHQCDMIKGIEHFKTPVSTGVEIIEALHGHTTGYAVPTYMIDAPGGGGKIPVHPDYVIGREGDDLLLKNYRGDLYRYPDPES